MNITEVEKLIGYTFKNKDILTQALTHSSFKKNCQNYEKLEFFGDSFLNFVVAKHLFQKRNNLSVGEMTKLRAEIVCTENLKNATKKMGLWSHVRLVENSKIASENKKLFADIFESIVGGIYVDGGEAQSEKFVMKALEAEIAKAGKNTQLTDYKTALQEYVQGRKMGEITYETTAVSGSSHTPSFEITLCVGGREIARANGISKKKASQACAKIPLEKYGD